MNNSKQSERPVRSSTCKHCYQPIRIHGGFWVHDDPDEDPTEEDYGWCKCLPSVNGSFTYAEPTEESMEPMCTAIVQSKAQSDAGCTELLERIVRSSFAAGENWGVTYSTWFTPSKADTAKQVKKAINNAKQIIRRYNSDEQRERG